MRIDEITTIPKVELVPDGKETGTRTMFKDAWTSYYFLVMVDDNHRGNLNVRIYRNSPAAEVNIWGLGENSLGPTIARQVLKKLKQRFPKITSLHGNRISGALKTKPNNFKSVKIRESVGHQPEKLFHGTSSTNAVSILTNGFTGYPVNESAKPKTRIQADDILRKAGYKRLGKGSFGAVYRKPGKPFVLKVFTANDQAYLDFVALAKAHQDNPHFPKFTGKVVAIPKFIDKAQVAPDICAIRMEPLMPYKYNQAPITTYLKWRDYKSDDPNSFVAMELEDAKEFLSEHPKLQEACDLIIDNLLIRHQCDLKQDNLMLRGSTIVFIDPVSSNPENYVAAELPYVEQPEPEPAPNPLSKRDSDLLDRLYDDLLK